MNSPTTSKQTCVVLIDGSYYMKSCEHVMSDFTKRTGNRCNVDFFNLLTILSQRLNISIQTVYYYQGTHDGRQNSFHNFISTPREEDSPQVVVGIKEMKFQRGALRDHPNQQVEVKVEKGVDVQLAATLFEYAFCLNGKTPVDRLLFISGDVEFLPAVRCANLAPGMAGKISLLYSSRALSKELKDFSWPHSEGEDTILDSFLEGAIRILPPLKKDKEKDSILSSELSLSFSTPSSSMPNTPSSPDSTLFSLASQTTMSSNGSAFSSSSPTGGYFSHHKGPGSAPPHLLQQYQQKQLQQQILQLQLQQQALSQSSGLSLPMHMQSPPNPPFPPQSKASALLQHQQQQLQLQFQQQQLLQQQQQLNQLSPDMWTQNSGSQSFPSIQSNLGTGMGSGGGLLGLPDMNLQTQILLQQQQLQLQQTQLQMNQHQHRSQSLANRSSSLPLPPLPSSFNSYPNAPPPFPSRSTGSPPSPPSLPLNSTSSPNDSLGLGLMKNSSSNSSASSSLVNDIDWRGLLGEGSVAGTEDSSLSLQGLNLGLGEGLGGLGLGGLPLSSSLSDTSRFSSSDPQFDYSYPYSSF